MFRPLWFGKLLGQRSRSVRRRQAAQHRRYVRLQLEGLEERVTPASLPFATAHNGSELQQNITFINGNTSQAWSFNLQANTTFNLTAQQELTAGANVKIVGLGNDVITPAAGIRAFKVDAGATAEFDNLTISGGKITVSDTSPGGAALWVDGGAATLNNVSVTNNTVFTTSDSVAPEAGGIVVTGAASSELTIAHSHIDDNQALGVLADGVTPPPQPVLAAGGGIFIGGGVINISDSTLSNNKAVGSNIAAGTGGGADGGGMYVASVTSVVLTNLTVDGNVAQGGSGGDGGAAQGGAFYFSPAAEPIKLVGSTVSNNKAIGGNSSGGTGGDAFGGALFNMASVHTATTILNSSFLLNTALGGNGFAGGDAFGGAIDRTEEAGQLNLLNSTLGQNKAQGGNGSALGQGQGFGGGLATFGVIPQLFNNTIAFNQALNGTGMPIGIPTTPGGGGIYAFVGIYLSDTLNNLVQGNTTNGVGPDVNIGGAVAPLGLGPFNVVGGAILQMAPTVTVVNGLPIYPLLPNATLAIQQGSTSVVAAIANAENTTPANATDEVGNPRTTNGGLQIDIGAVQLLTVNAPPPPPTAPPPPPPPPAPPTMSQAVLTLFVDAFEIVLSLDGFGPLLHLPSSNALLGSISDNLPFAGSLGIPALMAGLNAANDALSSAGP